MPAISRSRLGLARATKATAGTLRNTGSIDVFGGPAAARLTVKGNAGNSGQFNIDHTNFSSIGILGGAVLTVGATLANSGDLEIGNAGLARATKVTAAELVNTGDIGLTGGTARATLDVAAAAPATLSGGYFLAGNALLRYAGGAITALGSGAELALGGARARIAVGAETGRNSALSGLADNAGTLVLAGGATLATTAGLNNIGTIAIGGRRGGLLTVGGTLRNSGDLVIGSTSLARAATVTAAGLVSTGVWSTWRAGRRGRCSMSPRRRRRR
jgi:hypothetical protein